MAIEEAQMGIIPAVQCRTLDGWYPLQVRSESDPNIHYSVHVNPWANRSEQHVCECKSYLYRGYCKHQKEAQIQHCGWNEIEGPEEKLTNHDGSVILECPRCAGPAHWAMWEQND